MDAIRRISQIHGRGEAGAATRDKQLHWKAIIGGKEQEWNAEITEQIPDQRIAWKSQGGAPNAGVVTFQPLSDGTSKIMLHLEYEPQGIVEKAGDATGMVTERVEGTSGASRTTSKHAVRKPGPGGEQ